MWHPVKYLHKQLNILIVLLSKQNVFVDETSTVNDHSLVVECLHNVADTKTWMPKQVRKS